MANSRYRNLLSALVKHAAAVDTPDDIVRARAVLGAHRRFMLFLFLAVATIPLLGMLLR
jgi:hypothetical protein